MSSQEIYEEFGQEVYLFILKRVKNKHIANDIFQSSFLKIHKNTHQLKTESKIRAWVFQITRNEIANYFNKEITNKVEVSQEANYTEDSEIDICCFDRFIDDLPKIYKEVIQLTYISGKKQEEVAEMLDISTTNVKARIRRSKEMLRTKFLDCCKYDVNPHGKLIGTPDCSVCK